MADVTSLAAYEPWRAGRYFESTRTVRLGDADATGALRLDGAARFLQDIATDDWDATGIASSDVWVVRRTALRRVAPTWPRYGDEVTLRTWCSGVGGAWAERRTDLGWGDDLAIEYGLAFEDPEAGEAKREGEEGEEGGGGGGDRRERGGECVRACKRK